MSIRERLIMDMKQAMKDKDKASLSTIRLILAAIQRKEQDMKDDAIEKKIVFEGLTTDQVIGVIKSFKKQTEEELEGFLKRGDDVRTTLLRDSISLVSYYLPAEMTKNQIIEHLQSLLRSARAADPNINTGGFIKIAMIDLKGKADNKLVREVVDGLLKG